jgi:hypothetical protein
LEFQIGLYEFDASDIRSRLLGYIFTAGLASQHFTQELKVTHVSFPKLTQAVLATFLGRSI